jgi:hypothetical protein
MMKDVIYREPSSYFTKEMMEIVENWKKEHGDSGEDVKPEKKQKTEDGECMVCALMMVLPAMMFMALMCV